MAGPGTKHFAALMITLLVLTACHWDQYTKPDLTLLLASVENSFSATGRQREIPLVDETFLSEFPFRSSVAALTEEVTPEMISPELPLPPQVIFTMPMQMNVNCLSSTCGDGIQLSGKAEMVVDLDQRLVTLHQFDLRDSSFMHHLSGMMQLRFDEFDNRETALSNPCCHSQHLTGCINLTLMRRFCCMKLILRKSMPSSISKHRCRTIYF